MRSVLAQKPTIKRVLIFSWCSNVSNEDKVFLVRFKNLKKSLILLYF
jgi:hypothetical protein